MPDKVPTDSFDYVIVGAGSAGCVLANRLTADGRHRVLLLEAGGHDRHFWIHVPLGYGKLFSDARVNWLYASEPEPELDNRRIIQPRGKVLGGSSSINGLLYIRGQHEDFDRWRQLGNAGWSHDDVLPYFRRAEDQERGADALHGVGGPFAVSDVCEPHPLCEAFIEAVQQAGHPRNDDFNGAAQEGAGYFQYTARNGLRRSTAAGYLREARRRGNLEVVTNALATRILLDGRRATGIEYRRGGDTHVARADVEVILAGGAFHSPQLMQLSRLGPAALLQQHGIKVAGRHPGRRRRSAGSPAGALPVSLHRADHHERRGARLAPSRARGTALLPHPQGHAGDRRRLCGRLPAHQPASRDAGRAAALPDLQRRHRRRGLAQVSGLHRFGVPAAPGKPRLRAHQVGQPGRAARDPAALP